MRNVALAAMALCGCSLVVFDESNHTPSVLDAGEVDASKPVLDPKLFDCTAQTPSRKAASSIECLRDPKCKTRLVTGHRGAGGNLGRIAPEDSLSAYRAAIAMGADIVETDPRPTSDNVIVNIHDTTLDRTTSGTGEVIKKTYAEVHSLQLKTTFAGDFSCDRVPTLVEVLQLCVGRALVLVDANKTDRVDLLVKAIRDAGALDWALFDTSSTSKLDQALLMEPKIRIMPRIENASEAKAILDHYSLQYPMLVEIDQTIFPQAADVVHAAGTRVMTNAFAVDLGVKFGSDRKAYIDLYDQGADVLQSDLPDEVLRSLGRPVPP